MISFLYSPSIYSKELPVRIWLAPFRGIFYHVFIDFAFLNIFQKSEQCFETDIYPIGAIGGIDAIAAKAQQHIQRGDKNLNACNASRSFA